MVGDGCGGCTRIVGIALLLLNNGGKASPTLSPPQRQRIHSVFSFPLVLYYGRRLSLIYLGMYFSKCSRSEWVVFV